LGLSIVKNVADSHGADFVLSSNAGVGLTVSVYFPAPASAPGAGAVVGGSLEVDRQGL
jgi:signal transduction histidine kinase